VTPNGVDKAAQEHLADKSYPSVLVLGALALFVEALENFVTLAAAVLFARAVWWQTEVLGLLLHATRFDHRLFGLLGLIWSARRAMR
jgi:hypothetical protein